MAVIGSLTVKLGLVTVEWDKATAKAKKDAKDLQAAFNKLGLDLKSLQNLFRNLGGTAVLSVAGITAMTHAIMDMASQMQDVADATGVTEGKVLQFQKALALAGGKAEDASTILGTLFTKISAAKDGNDAAIAGFEQLGISFKELKAATPDQIIGRVYQGLSNLGDSFERVKATKEILGKAGLGKSIVEIADALGQSTRKFDEQAKVLQRWDKTADALQITYANLKMAIAELLVPFTTEKVFTVEQFKSALVAITAVTVVNGLFKIVAAFKALNAALKTNAALSVAISTLNRGKGIALGASALAAYAGAMKVFGEDDELGPKNEVRGTIKGATVPTPDGEGKKGGNAASQQRARLEFLKEQIRFSQLRNDLQVAYLSGNQYELKIAESIVQKEEEQARALSERNAQLANEKLSSEQRALAEDEYQTKMQKAASDDKDRRALITAQRQKAFDLLRLETQQASQRNSLAEKLRSLEEGRLNINEGEYQRNQAQLALEGKLLTIRQAEAKYALENKDNTKSREFQETMQQFAAQRLEAEKAYASQVKIINRDEQIRHDLLRLELTFTEQRNRLETDSLELQNKARYMTVFDYEKAQARLDLEKRLLDIEQQRKELQTKRKDISSVEYQSEQQRLNQAEEFAKRENKIRLENISLNEKEAQDWSAGWEAAMREFAMNAQNYGNVAKEMFSSVTSNMGMALDNFVRTGKLSFKDLARSIIQDLIAIQLKAQAMRMFSLVGSLFSTAATYGTNPFSQQTQMLAAQDAGLKPFADGGTPPVNAPSLVGENGPELFVPRTSGTIIPNNRLGDMLGGGQTINYNGPFIQNMSAIDTQSATQFLSVNKMAVWAASQSASRSIPKSR